MTHLTGHDRSQMLLLPEAVDDYVGSDNPVRFIDAFVDGLDLSAASFTGVEPKVTGRPGYAPADLLKLYIDGYLNRVRSSRSIAEFAQFEHVEQGVSIDQVGRVQPLDLRSAPSGAQVVPIGEGRGSTELTALLFRRSGFCSSARRWLERGTGVRVPLAKLGRE